MTSRSQRHHSPQPSKPTRTKAEILEAVTEALQMTEMGLADLLGDAPPRRLPGLRNVVVWGRSVTNVIQNLRGPIGREAFDSWYTPWREEMEADDLLKYFYRQRSAILKEGKGPRVFTSAAFSFNTDELQPLLQHPPPGAKGFFIGDTLGGSGWEVTLPDGTEEKYYVSLPDHLDIDISLHVDEPPTSHGGEPLADTSIEALATRYVEYLRRLVRSVHETFGA